MNDLQEKLAAWNGEQLLTSIDHPTNSLICIGIHSSVLGPATGGTRMQTYATPEAAISDCLALSKSMTHKFALANFPRGGGKAVISVPASLTPTEKRGLLERYGQLLSRLKGLFYTGPDMGITPEDLNTMGQYAPDYVFCRTNASGQANNSGDATALGVLSAIKSTVKYLEGVDDLKDKTIVVQGAGSVGSALIKLLLHEKSKVIFTDIHEPNERLINDGAVFVSPAKIYHQEGIIFCPCAQGGILNETNIQQLHCKAVVGAANNQLSHPEAIQQLQTNNILYAPDFAVNIGGAMAITGMEALQWSQEKASAEIAKIGDTIEMIYIIATHKKISTVDAALQIVEERLTKK